MARKGRPKGAKSRCPNDVQREKLYRAEHSVPGHYDVSFDNLQEVNRYVHGVFRRRYWKKITRIDSLILVSTSRVKAYGGQDDPFTAFLNLPSWAWTKPIIAHELAHSATPPRLRLYHGVEVKGRAAHGPEFAGTYLYLLGHMVSLDYKAEMKRAFLIHNVDWDSKFARGY